MAGRPSAAMSSLGKTGKGIAHAMGALTAQKDGVGNAMGVSQPNASSIKPRQKAFAPAKATPLVTFPTGNGTGGVHWSESQQSSRSQSSRPQQPKPNDSDDEFVPAAPAPASSRSKSAAAPKKAKSESQTITLSSDDEGVGSAPAPAPADDWRGRPDRERRARSVAAPADAPTQSKKPKRGELPDADFDVKHDVPSTLQPSLKAAPPKLAPISIRAKRVTIGKFNCGPCTVHFDGETFQWIIDTPAHQPSSKKCGPFEIEARSVEFLEVNKTDGFLGIWGPFFGGFFDDADIRAAYSPFANRNDPKNGVRIQYYKDDYPTASFPSDIMKLCPKFRLGVTSAIVSFVPHFTGKPGKALQQLMQQPRPSSSSSQSQSRGRAMQQQAAQGGGEVGRRNAGSSGGAGSSSGRQEKLQFYGGEPRSRDHSYVPSVRSAPTVGSSGMPVRGSLRLAANRARDSEGVSETRDPSEKVLVYPDDVRRHSRHAHATQSTKPSPRTNHRWYPHLSVLIGRPRFAR